MRMAGRLFAAFLLCVGIAHAQTSIKSAAEVAPGVYLIRHNPAFGAIGQGNTTVIVGKRQVLVVDTAITGESARTDIEQIRKWTDKPVTYLLNTHWHGDHNFANAAYLQAFPQLSIVAHSETKKDMDLINASSIARSVASLKKQKDSLASGKDDKGEPLTADARKQLEETVAYMEKYVADREQMGYQGPTLTFAENLTVDLGERIVEIKFLGRGNTSGDAVAWLPKEKVLVTGDLIVRPLPYTYDGYPTEWVTVLDRMAALEPSVIVPGHGDAMRDTAFLLLVRDIFKSAIAQLDEQVKIQGPAEFLTLDQVKDKIDLSSFRPRFVAEVKAAFADPGTDTEIEQAFNGFAARVTKLVFSEAALR